MHFYISDKFFIKICNLVITYSLAYSKQDLFSTIRITEELNLAVFDRSHLALQLRSYLQFLLRPHNSSTSLPFLIYSTIIYKIRHDFVYSIDIHAPVVFHLPDNSTVSLSQPYNQSIVWAKASEGRACFLRSKNVEVLLDSLLLFKSLLAVKAWRETCWLIQRRGATRVND